MINLKSLSFLLLTLSQVQAETPVRPNIILVMADDLGFSDVGFNGNTTVRTPHLDRMAAGGLILDRFYAASAVCSPTRGSCLTGRHPTRYGIPTANSGHMLVPEITLAELLKENGYTTGHFGKWHLGTLTETEPDANRGGPKGAPHFAPPRHHGYDTSFSTESKVPTFDPMIRPEGSGKTWWNAVTESTSTVPYGTAYWEHDGSRAASNLDGDDSKLIVDRAIKFATAAALDQVPFFATVWFHAPHLPVVAASEDAALYAGLDGYSQNYFGCITALDRAAGLLWAKLEEIGAAENTLLLFCSDNGPEGKAGSAPGSAAPLRGRKRDVYEGGVRVPAFALWPRMIKPGTRSSFPAVTSDYLPTALDLLSLSMPDERPLDGVSLASLFSGKEPSRPAPIFFRFQKRLAATGSCHKLVSYDAGKTFALYDLSADPAESADVSSLFPEVAADLKSQLMGWHRSCEESAAGKDY